jgi:1,4-alpha-glucan branching enzyme
MLYCVIQEEGMGLIFTVEGENLEHTSFKIPTKQCTLILKGSKQFAEESTSFPMVSRPTSIIGGLEFRLEMDDGVGCMMRYFKKIPCTEVPPK